MKQLDSKLISRLKACMITGGALALAKGASAAVVYTDINPDYNGGVGNTYNLDLNNDGTADFEIYHDGFYNLFLAPLAANNEALGTGSSNYQYPYALNTGASISASASGNWNNNGFSTGYQSLNYGSYGTFGHWVNVADKYLGLRFQVGGNTYYGWARLTVNSDGSSWIVKDYAYEDTPGVGITAGAGIPVPIFASGAQNLMATDIANNDNGSDLQITFDAGLDETTIAEYHAMVVKSANAATFDLAAAQAVSGGNYSVIATAGTPSYTTVFGTTATDVDGDPVTSGVPYTIFIHSVADGTNATVDSLSLPATATLHLPVNIATGATATDNGDIGDPTDLQVSFNAAANEATVSEYRIMIVQQSMASLFNTIQAQAVPPAAYASVSPSALSNYVHDFGSSAVDVTGSPVEQGMEYVAFIFSKADGNISINDSLSAPSNVVNLKLPAGPVTSVAGSDIGDNNNGTDLEVTFDAAANEALVGEYRIVVVKENATTAFDLTSALALPAAQYHGVAPDGSGQYAITLASGLLDSDGDAITIGQNYQLFVLSMKDASLAHTDALSAPSAPVMLNIQANAVANISASDVGNNHDASDIEVTFDAAQEENQIASYRVMIVPATEAAGFTLNMASNVAPGNYFETSVDGSANYTAALTSTTKDVNGSDVLEDMEYNIFVLSKANGTGANIDSLSAASDVFILNNTVGVQDLAMASKVSVQQQGGTLDFRLRQESGTALQSVALHDITGKIVASTGANSNHAVLDVSGLAAGYYVAVISTNAGNETRKLFIHK